jgi:hypothetical protein
VTVSWVGASVRARLLLRRRVGHERAAQLARSPSLREALQGLAGTAYGRELEPGLDLESAQRAVAAANLLHLRLLSGWLPPGQAECRRSLAAWYELANVEDRLAYLRGGELRPPFVLGGLASAWPGASRTISPIELRGALARSAWGDPGGDTAADVHVGLRIAWARRVLAEVPELRDLAAGALVLFLARELFVTGRPVEHLLRPRIAAVGSGWAHAQTFEELAESLPAHAGWVLEGLARSEELWLAEVRWWGRAEALGWDLVTRLRASRGEVTGAAVLLAVDAWRTASALAAAAAGGAELTEALRGPH